MPGLGRSDFYTNALDRCYKFNVFQTGSVILQYTLVFLPLYYYVDVFSVFSKMFLVCPMRHAAVLMTVDGSHKLVPLDDEVSTKCGKYNFVQYAFSV